MDMSKNDDGTNKVIRPESKLLIGIGDSFCAGAGTESYELWEKNNWDVEKMRNEPLAYSQQRVGSFINQICEKHLKDYLPVNLGMSGKGNRFAIRELFLNPNLNIETAREKILVFVVSDFSRFDVANEICDISYHATTLWPSYVDKNRLGYADLQDHFGESIYTEKFVLSEFLLDMFMLLNWCEINNTKLLLISGFTPELNRDYFFKTFMKGNESFLRRKVVSKLINKIPWHNIIQPMGYGSMIDMLLHLEKRDDLIPKYGFRNFNIEKTSDFGWISKCQHPTKKGHELICDIVYQYILNYDNFVIPNYDLIDQKYFQQEDMKNKTLF
jgi:hypothetical protein